MARLSKKRIREELEKYSGNISAVARAFGVQRNSIYHYIKKHDMWPEVEEQREKILDNVESTLYKQALAGNTTALIFWLKCQGRGRGWVERQEITGADGKDMNITLQWEDNGNDNDA